MKFFILILLGEYFKLKIYLNSSIILLIIVIIILVSTSLFENTFALQCYQCASTTNYNCADPFNSNGISVVTCTGDTGTACTV